jgi:hypothetical protein
MIEDAEPSFHQPELQQTFLDFSFFYTITQAPLTVFEFVCIDIVV